MKAHQYTKAQFLSLQNNSFIPYNGEKHSALRGQSVLGEFLILPYERRMYHEQYVWAAIHAREEVTSEVLRDYPEAEKFQKEIAN